MAQDGNEAEGDLDQEESPDGAFGDGARRKEKVIGDHTDPPHRVQVYMFVAVDPQAWL